MDVTQVSVTREDVERGLPRNSCRCPIALAVARAAGTEDGWVWVDVDCIRIRELGGMRFAETPDVALDFIVAFDNFSPTGTLLEDADSGSLSFELTWHDGEPEDDEPEDYS